MKSMLPSMGAATKLTRTGLAAVLFLGFSYYVCLAQTSPVAYWKADGNTLDSAGSYHGTNIGGLSFNTGMLGQAFAFDGRDDLVGNAPLKLISNNFTMVFWAYPTASRVSTPETNTINSGTSGQRYAIGPQYDEAMYPGALAGVSVGNNGVSVFEHASGYLPSLLVYDTPISGWTHVAVVYSNRQPSLYVNGSLVRIGLRSERDPVSPSAVLGGDGSFTYGPYKGLLDEIMIYDRAIESEEIAAIAGAQIAVLVHGKFVTNSSISVRGPTEVKLLSAVGSTILFSLNGSDPTITGVIYAGPITVKGSCLLRAVAYNQDFTKSFTRSPVNFTVLPTMTPITAGGGTISVEPSEGDYYANSAAILTATPAAGWKFLHWLGDASGTNPVTEIRVTRNKVARAVFGTPLNRSTIGGGSIVADPLSDFYPYGSPVRLTAIPITGNYHALWGNAAAGETNNPMVFTVAQANGTVAAVFGSLVGASNSLTIVPSGYGDVTTTPGGTVFARGSNVLVQAVPHAGQSFLGWSGAVNGVQNPLTLNINSNRVITANFTRNPTLLPETNTAVVRDDGFRLEVVGEFNAVYGILASTDLLDWVPLGLVTNTYGVTSFTDPTATNTARRLYRAVGR